MHRGVIMCRGRPALLRGRFVAGLPSEVALFARAALSFRTPDRTFSLQT